MPRVVITGGPGAGKTTLLAVLARRGFATVSESAREVIAERLSRGEAPRPSPENFAREILRRDMMKYDAHSEHAQVVLYDRCEVESLGMVNEVAKLQDEALKALLDTHRFHRVVFVLPPWKAIYRTDTERDHTFEHAQRVHREIVRWYCLCGYAINEVPRLPEEQRATYVLQHLADESDA